MEHAILLEQFVIVSESRPVETVGYLASCTDQRDQCREVVLFSSIEAFEAMNEAARTTRRGPNSWSRRGARSGRSTIYSGRIAVFRRISMICSRERLVRSMSVADFRRALEALANRRSMDIASLAGRVGGVFCLRA